MNPNERTLELDKILELLANEAANDLTREQARHLQPQTDLAVVQAELEKTDVIYGWLGGIEEKNANGAYTFRWLSNSELDFLFNGAGKNYWFPGEPSCIDANSAATVEPYLQIWKIKEQWSLNDNSNQALQVYSSKPYRFGYVVEYNW